MQLMPELILRAYAMGIFPMADSRTGQVRWYEPQRRGVLEFECLKVSRSLRKVINSSTFHVTINQCFADVIAACADRDTTWISREIEQVFCELHELGFAHSVEVWHQQQLVGGLYGVALQGAFFGESMFHRMTDASKVGFVFLVRHLQQRGFQLLDLQYITDHLQSLGGIEISRDAYLRRLHSALRVSASFNEPE
jgi:leucyl/phenylalanyl-tRNA--protein transferase